MDELAHRIERTMLSSVSRMHSVSQKSALRAGVSPFIAAPRTCTVSRPLVSFASPQTTPIVSSLPAANRRSHRSRISQSAAAPSSEASGSTAPPGGKFISRTEVPNFIQRDDLMDQLKKWAIIEAGEGGFR